MRPIVVFGVFILANSVMDACVNTPYWRKRGWLTSKSPSRIREVFHSSSKQGIDLWEQLAPACRTRVLCLPEPGTKLPYALQLKRKLYLEAYPLLKPRFTILLSRQKDILMSFEAWFHDKKGIRWISRAVFVSSRKNRKWSGQKASNHFPFQQLSYFSMIVERSLNKYIIKVQGVSGSYIWRYQDRYRRLNPEVISFTGLHVFSLQET